MKFLIVALAFVVYAHADVSELKLEKHVTVAEPNLITTAAESAVIATAAEPEVSYLPPPPIDTTSEIITNTVPLTPVNTYVPPPAIAPIAEEAVSAFVPPEPPVAAEPINAFAEIEQTPEDGYRYKTVRRVVYRHRT